VAGIAHVLVVLRLAGEREHVVAADGVAHDLHERVHVDVVVLAVDAGRRHGGAHQRAGRDAIDPALEPALELVAVEGEEIRALLPAHVDDLDELALAHLVGQRRGAVDAEVEPGLGERRRQLDLVQGPRRRAPDLDHQGRRRRLAVDHAPAGRGDDQHDVALDAERLRGPGLAGGSEQPHGARVVRAQAARVQRPEEAVVGARLHQPAQHGGGRVGRPGAERAGILAPVERQRGQLGRLPAVRVDHRHRVAAVQLDHRGRAGPHPPGLERAVGRPQP
jgi:hypothetical protein